MNHGRRDLLSILLGVPVDAPASAPVEAPADHGGIGRRDLLSIFMWIVLALVGRWKIPAQLAPAAKVVDGFLTQTVQTHRAIFKGGTLKLSMRIKGWEMPEGWRGFVDSPEFKSALAMGVGAKEEKTDDSIAAG